MGAGPYTSWGWLTSKPGGDLNGIIHGTKWTSPLITYSFTDSFFDYQAGYGTHGFFVSQQTYYQFSAAQQSSTRWILETGGAYSVAGLTGLGIAFAGYGAGNATLRYANTSSVDTARVGDFPGSYWNSGLSGKSDVYGYSMYQGDVWIGRQNNQSGVPYAGTFHYATLMHETGHALGLKHPHDYGFNDSFRDVLSVNYDYLEYTIMSYREHYRDEIDNYQNSHFPQTFMMLDIAALQYLYGADFSTNAGNTRYSWDAAGNSYLNGAVVPITSPYGKIFQTIWDGNGNDTYDLRNFSAGMTVDLRPGQYSYFSSDTVAYLGGSQNQGYARGNVYNALQFYGDSRSLIENAWGGVGPDRLIGNTARNTLWGNNGNDQLYGLAGNDTLDGGGGQDLLVGGDGDDLFKFRFLSDSTTTAPDTINDMSRVGTLGGDIIDLREIDANLTLAGDQAFRPGSTGAGGMATFNNGSYTEVRLYVDARAGHDATIWINDGATITAASYSGRDGEDFYL
ncbi:M10 family metallopeptidase [Amaricoccus sp.]|uniref:M10 family metallopeptidase n=1 Tax=Amaricoccus sp. TaxID=1872485 RepID=UPI001B505F6B|nr:M10 family metallopeptidase [Amaricoccus sp.]MBP7002137.1 M10 family metallopeptidase [Amaricoccus sp.]